MKKPLVTLEKILLTVLCGILFAAPFNKHLVKIFYYLALVLWLALNILKYKSKFYKGLFSYASSGKAIVVFFLAAVISTIFSLNPYYSQEILFQRFFLYFIIFFLGINLIRESVGPLVINFWGKKISLSNLSIIAGSFLLLGAIIGAGGVWDYFRFHPVRLWTVFGKEISFKMLPVYLAYLTPFSFAFFVCSKNKLLKIAGFVTFGLLFFVLVCNGSRGAWVAVVISLIFIVFFLRKKRYILFFLFLIITAIYLMPQYYQQRAKAILQPFSKNTFVARKSLFSFAVDVFKTKPVFGVGVGMYEVFPGLAKNSAGKRTHLHAHNTYLEVLCEMGVVGLLAFLWIFVAFFKNVFRPIRLCRDRNSQAIQIGLVSSILAGLIFALSCTIITVGFQDAVMFWLLFGVATSLIPQEKRNIGVRHER